MKKIILIATVFFISLIPQICKAGFLDSIKSGIDETKRIVKGEPKIEPIMYHAKDLDKIEAKGSLSNFRDNTKRINIEIYNGSNSVITKVDVEVDADGHKYSVTLPCGEIHPQQAGTCTGYLKIFNFQNKWSFDLFYYGYVAGN